MSQDAARAIVGYGYQPGRLEILRERTLVELRGAVRKRGRFILSVPELDIAPGEITALVGPNGAGKTTLLHMLAGMLALDEGAIHHRFRGGDDPWGEGLGEHVPLRDMVRYRREVAFVPQSPPAYFGTLRYALELLSAESGYRGREAVERAAWYLNRLGLDAYADHRFRQLSDGYRMRAAIALELVRQPQVLLLDEPIGPLDVKAQEVVLRDLRDIADSETWPLPIVISSQHLHEIEAVADRVVFVRDGQVAFYGTSADLAARAQGSVFELRCSLSDAQVRQALAGLVEVEDGHRARATLLRGAERVPSSEILKRLLAAGAEVEAFRDLSGSTRTLFKEAG